MYKETPDHANARIFREMYTNQLSLKAKTESNYTVYIRAECEYQKRFGMRRYKSYEVFIASYTRFNSRRRQKAKNLTQAG